jgi:archaellum component FlaC
MDCDLDLILPVRKKIKFDIPKTRAELADDIFKSINELRNVIRNITDEIKELENTLELVLD